MMKKVIFIALVLSIGLWSCSQNDEPGDAPDDYVDVTIGLETKGLKSIIEPGGTTTWNVNDEVRIVDIDGVPRKFAYGGETAQRSAEFKGTLRSGQGKNIYKAYHAPEKSKVELERGHILVVEREDLDITEDGVNYNSALFGSYCPMVAVPIEFDAENTDESKVFQFHHLTTMIEGRISLRETEDAEFLNKKFDRVEFEVRAIESKPFYTKIKFDMDLLKVDDDADDLDECIIDGDDESVKTDIMSTTMNMKERTIKELMREYAGLKSFPIPIFALPTEDDFRYTATVCFYYGETVQLKMQGSQNATGLNPVGLNVLDFDYKKIVRE